jgi:hypothetical protein
MKLEIAVFPDEVGPIIKIFTVIYLFAIFQNLNYTFSHLN